MRIKTISLQLSLCLFLHFMLLAPSAALARDIRVDDECSLHEAIITLITEASTGGCHMPTWGNATIKLQRDITLSEPLPEITADLTIEGFGHKISGDKLHQVFTVYNSDLTISDLTIVDGFSAEHGGAIQIHSDELKLSNSSIGRSVAIDKGGAIYVWRTATTIVDSQVERSFAREDAGGILAVDTNLEIRHSAVHANRALEQGGGLVLARVDAMILDTTVSDNLAG